MERQMALPVAARRNGAAARPAPPPPFDPAPLSASAAPAPAETEAPDSPPRPATRTAAKKAGKARKAAPASRARKSPSKKKAAPAPVWERFVVSVGAAAVRLVAAIVSYEHMRALAVEAGEGWRSWLLPISVDGLAVVALVTIRGARRTGAPADRLAWLALGLALAASLAANVAAAHPTLAGRVVAAWPPVALLTAEVINKHRGGSGFRTRRRPGAVEPLDPSRPTGAGRKG